MPSIRYLPLILIPLILFSCSSQKKVKQIKCSKIYTKKFTEILDEKYKTVFENDTITYNEIRFECVNSAFYTHKVMYEKFGKWDKEIFPKNRRHPILMWENIELFSNGKKYTVLTNGLEEWKHIYASVMIFDDNKKDQLGVNSEIGNKVKTFFAELLKNHDPDKRAFYEIYWKSVK
jgi:hypothetical protein